MRTRFFLNSNSRPPKSNPKRTASASLLHCRGPRCGPVIPQLRWEKGPRLVGRVPFHQQRLVFLRSPGRRDLAGYLVYHSLPLLPTSNSTRACLRRDKEENGREKSRGARLGGIQALLLENLDQVLHGREAPVHELAEDSDVVKIDLKCSRGHH